MSDGHSQNLTAGKLACERRVGFLGAQMDVAAGEAKVFVAHQRPRQEADFREHLEAVADSEDQPALRGVTADRLHDRSKFRQRSGPQIVAVSESAGNDHAIDTFQIGVFMPEDFRLGAENVARDMQRVVIAIGAGENDHAEFHEVVRLSGSQAVDNPTT